MHFTVIIPARFASHRLPGKPLADIAGRPMIAHVYERALLSDASKVLIATDDSRIAAAATAFNADVCMTSKDCLSGTDRLQEVAATLAWDDEHIVVNVQGDEPLIPPAVINQVANNLAHNSQAQMATLAAKLHGDDDKMNPNIVKVVMDCHGRALYFSRAPIPWVCNDLTANAQHFRHIGIYAYRVSLLHRFVQWGPGMLEQSEKLEQLRALENGVTIHVSEALEPVPPGVDTQHELEQIRACLVKK